MFVFYDTETSGLDKDFSQIFQIALVFTDDDLNILSSKKLECRRSPWVIPSPGAMLITGFSPDDLKNGPYSHFEMMQEIDAWIRRQHWPLTFIGYNSLGFDEPLLAQNFHQNLLEPDLTTSGNAANGQKNGRADILKLVKILALYMPGALTLDNLNEFGKKSLSLIEVARQNGVSLSDDDAHDAMNDIKATIGVAKVIRKAAPDIWDHMMSLTTAKGVDDFIAGHEIFTFSNTALANATQHRHGMNKAQVVTALPSVVGEHQVLADVGADPTRFLSLSVEQLKNVLRSKDAPLVLISKTEQPVLMPMEMSDAVLPADYDEALAKSRADALKKDAAFLTRLQQAVEEIKAAKPALANPLPEQNIYAPVADELKTRLKDWMREFHTASDWTEAAKVAADFQTRFAADLAADPGLIRYASFAARIVFENDPSVLSPEKTAAMKKKIAERILNTDLRAPYMTIPKARKELEEIERDRVAGSKKWTGVTDSQIRALKLYYTAIEKEYAPHALSLSPPSVRPPPAGPTV